MLGFVEASGDVLSINKFSLSLTSGQTLASFFVTPPHYTVGIRGMERAVLRFTGAVELVDDEKLPRSFLLDPTRREVIVGREGKICPTGEPICFPSRTHGLAN